MVAKWWRDQKQFSLLAFASDTCIAHKRKPNLTISHQNHPLLCGSSMLCVPQFLHHCFQSFCCGCCYFPRILFFQESSFHSLLFSKTRRSAFSAPLSPQVRKRGFTSSTAVSKSGFSASYGGVLPVSPPPPSVPATSSLSEKSRRHRKTPTPPPAIGGSTERATNGWTSTENEVCFVWLIETGRTCCCTNSHCLETAVCLPWVHIQVQNWWGQGPSLTETRNLYVT